VKEVQVGLEKHCRPFCIAQGHQQIVPGVAFAQQFWHFQLML